MAKVFVDVGAHLGETLEVAMDRRWGFDRIYSFEPAPSCWPALRELADDRVEICPFGLWTEDARLELHDAGLIEGSLLTEGGQSSSSTTEVEVKDAARWFADNIRADDEVVVKVNCEGAECDLLDHLLEQGQLKKVDELLVHFDVRKIPGLHHREQETRQRIGAAGVSYHLAESIFFGGNVHDKTTNWLSWYHSPTWARVRYTTIRRTTYGLQVRGRLLGKELGLVPATTATGPGTTPDGTEGTQGRPDAPRLGLGRWLVPSAAVSRLVRRSSRRSRSESALGRALGDLTRYRLARRWGVVLHPSAEVGAVRFAHPSSIVIGAGVVIEDGVVLYQDVSLGAGDDDPTCAPIVRQGAQILTGAAVIGAVEVGEGAVVAAHSVVLHDVAPGSFVAGAPARAVDQHLIPLGSTP